MGGGGQNLFYFYVAQHGRGTCNNFNQIASKYHSLLSWHFSRGSFFFLILCRAAFDATFWAGINDGQTMDKPWTNDGQLIINASSREVTVSSIGCAFRAELILGR